jgi:hypothetical protein
MPNKHVENRLRSVQKALMESYLGGKAMSSASRGGERENFVSKYLRQVLPPPHRTGSGDITDWTGAKSGQVDVVIEYPFLPSLALLGGRESLYLAESVASVIEVKSDLLRQWKEVERTARAVKKLVRPGLTTLLPRADLPSRIPVFAVGYKGWKSLKRIEERLTDGTVDGILVIEAGLFVPYPGWLNQIGYGFSPSLPSEGPWALWGLLSCLTQTMTGLHSTGEAFSRYELSPAKS